MDARPPDDRHDPTIEFRRRGVVRPVSGIGRDTSRRDRGVDDRHLRWRCRSGGRVRWTPGVGPRALDGGAKLTAHAEIVIIGERSGSATTLRQYSATTRAAIICT